jgi:hypothetical protein
MEKQEDKYINKRIIEWIIILIRIQMGDIEVSLQVRIDKIIKIKL